ncbi:hypothetical protein HYH03_010673 [Edaphochlamys debaryana]|uniref:Uncharacterized protein n=1 Tax=Edaphochlamys debaryana TaxID=47281 RepID=A0A835XYZ5_9CHLO|nr:hypothetical protein HYH03_010673 [Edaphochlamys debaryana]|eukprot:KAG2491001.1 hypothetical protein HYH03_010673 [Edaphochlamys debaryana]
MMRLGSAKFPLGAWIRRASEVLGREALQRRQLNIFWWNGAASAEEAAAVVAKQGKPACATAPTAWPGWGRWRAATIRGYDNDNGAYEIKYHDEPKRSSAAIWLPFAVTHYARCPPGSALEIRPSPLSDLTYEEMALVAAGQPLPGLMPASAAGDDGSAEGGKPRRRRWRHRRPLAARLQADGDLQHLTAASVGAFPKTEDESDAELGPVGLDGEAEEAAEAAPAWAAAAVGSDLACRTSVGSGSGSTCVSAGGSAGPAAAAATAAELVAAAPASSPPASPALLALPVLPAGVEVAAGIYQEGYDAPVVQYDSPVLTYDSPDLRAYGSPIPSRAASCGASADASGTGSAAVFGARFKRAFSDTSGTAGSEGQGQSDFAAAATIGPIDGAAFAAAAGAVSGAAGVTWSGAEAGPGADGGAKKPRLHPVLLAYALEQQVVAAAAPVPLAAASGASAAERFAALEAATAARRRPSPGPSASSRELGLRELYAELFGEGSDLTPATARAGPSPSRAGLGGTPADGAGSGPAAGVMAASCGSSPTGGLQPAAAAAAAVAGPVALGPRQAASALAGPLLAHGSLQAIGCMGPVAPPPPLPFGTSSFPGPLPPPPQQQPLLTAPLPAGFGVHQLAAAAGLPPPPCFQAAALGPSGGPDMMLWALPPAARLLGFTMG